MCFEEFTTSPYEMLVLVKQFFQDINQLLQNQETFEKDCSQVYRRTCLGPRKAGSSPGEMPRLYLCPANPCRAGGLGLTCMEQLDSRVSPVHGHTRAPWARHVSALVPVSVARLVAIPAGWPWRCVGELCACVWGEPGLGEGAGRPLEVGFGLNPAGNKARERC